MGAAAKTEDDETGVMVASTSLKPASEALLAEMEEGLKCHGCHKEHGKLACAACGTTSYCGRDCQMKDWHAGHKVKCKVFKKANESIDELFALKRPAITLPELQRLTRAFETLTALKAHTHRHFFRALALIGRVTECPSRAAQDFDAFKTASGNAILLSEACQAFMTRHPKRFGAQEEGVDAKHDAKSNDSTLSKAARMRERKARAEQKAQQAARVAAETDEILGALNRFRMVSIRVEPADAPIAQAHGNGESDTGEAYATILGSMASAVRAHQANGNGRRGLLSAADSKQAEENQIYERMGNLALLVQMYETQQWAQLGAFAMAQVEGLCAPQAGGATPPEDHQSLELAAYLSALGTMSIKTGHLREGVELLQKGLGMFEDKALRAQPFHLLRITGHRTRDDEHLFDMLNLIFLSAYRSLAQTTGANGFRDEAWIIYEKAHETVKRMGESGMHKRDKLTYHGISYEFLNEMVRAAVAKGDHATAYEMSTVNEKELRHWVDKHGRRTDRTKITMTLYSELERHLKEAACLRASSAFNSRRYVEAIEAVDRAIPLLAPDRRNLKDLFVATQLRQAKYLAQLRLGHVEAAIETMEAAVEGLEEEGPACAMLDAKELESKLTRLDHLKQSAPDSKECAKLTAAVEDEATRAQIFGDRMMICNELLELLNEPARQGLPGTKEKVERCRLRLRTVAEGQCSAQWVDLMKKTRERARRARELANIESETVHHAKGADRKPDAQSGGSVPAQETDSAAKGGEARKLKVGTSMSNRSNKKDDSVTNKCGICTEEEGNEQWATLRGCGHRYHSLCLNMWHEVTEQTPMNYACPHCAAVHLNGWRGAKTSEYPGMNLGKLW